MTKVVSNKRQLRRMVELLQDNLDIAKAICSKSASQHKWEEFTVELNRLGPPQREWQKWMRVWADLKCKIKKKKTENLYVSCPSGTRVNPTRSFSDLEETVIEMLDFNSLITQPALETEYEDSKMTDSSSNEVKFSATDFDEEMMKYNSYESLEAQTDEHPIKIKTEKFDPEEEDYSTIEVEKTYPTDEYKKILEDQTFAQKEFYNKMTDLMSDMQRSMSNIEDYIKKGVQQRNDLLELKRLKLKAYKETQINQTIDRKAKLRMKAELLAMKKKKQHTTVIE